MKTNESRKMELNASTRQLVVTRPEGNISFPIKSPRDSNPEGWREHNQEILRKAFALWDGPDFEISKEIVTGWKALGLVK